VSSDYEPALWIPSPFYWEGRSGNRVRWIILHGTAGGSSAQGVAEWFQNPASQASTHYIIGQDGTVVQCVAEANSAWGNGIVQDGPGCYPPYATGIPPANQGHGSWWDSGPNPNYVTISIEHVKPHTDNSDQITLAQQNASFALVAHLCAKYAVPPRWADANGGITGHFSIESSDRSLCPGPYPWPALFGYLNPTQGGRGPVEKPANPTPSSQPPSGSELEIWNAVLSHVPLEPDSPWAAAWLNERRQGDDYDPGPVISNGPIAGGNEYMMFFAYKKLVLRDGQYIWVLPGN